MKRVCTFFIILIALSCWTSVADAQTVRMPDENLAAVVRDALGLARGAPITRQVMQRLTFLDAQSYKVRVVTGQEGQIENITGLEQATQLTRLWLTNNRIRDIRLLSRLTQLEELSIWYNEISDIGPLAGLKQLRVLEISNNPINDFSPLAGLVRLQRLGVSVQRISDLRRHVDLTRLQSLRLHGSDNQIEDLRLLANLTQLTNLSISRVQLRDLSFLERLTQLESLNFSQNEISDLKPLANLTQLEWLGLFLNEISDLKPLANLTQLRWLDLGWNQISDLKPLAGLTQLRSLYLRHNQIRDVTPLADLVKLEYLGLRDNPIEDASPLAVLTRLRDVDIEIPEPRPGVTTAPAATGNVVIPDAKLASAVRKALGLGSNAAITKQRIQGLTRLDARDSQIKNLTGLEHATRLTSLELRDNQIRDIRPLANLKNLTELILDNNRVSNIRPLTNMKQLTWLLLGKNPISDFTPLTNLTELRGLSFWGNNVRDVTLFADLTKLTNLWLGLNKISNITPLADLVNLKVLSLHDNQIRDVSPLAGLVNLETLHLGENPIQDTSPLASLTKLRDVDIEIPEPPPDATTGPTSNGSTIGLPLTTGGRTVLQSHKFHVYSRGTYYPHENRVGRIVLNSPTVNRYIFDELTDRDNLTGFFRRGGTIELIANPRMTDVDFGDVVISEIMWGLNGTSPENQWIELYNTTEGAITLSASPNQDDWVFLFTYGAVSKRETIRDTGSEYANWKVVDRVSNMGWKVPGQSGNISQNQPLISMYRTINYTTGHVPDGTLASSWKASTGRVSLLPPSYGTPGTKHLQPTSVVRVELLDHPPMYWVDTNSGTLHRLVGAEVENLVPSVRNATGLAIDVAGSKLYWTERTGDSTGRIRRANLDGRNVQLVKNLTSVPQGLALDAANGKIYVTNAWGKIQRLNVDGSNFQPNLITGLERPRGLALDVSGGKVYWAEMSGRIRRANLDGSNIEGVATGLGTPINIAIFDNTVYWTQKTGENLGEIRFVNLQGNVVTRNSFTQGFPVGIAVDAVERTFYWTTSHGKIGRQALDGSNFQPNFVTGLSAPGTLALRVETPMDVETPEILTTDALLSISPSPVISPAVGEQLTLNLKITAGEAVAGYQFIVRFDPTALRYVESGNGEYLPTGAFFVQPVVNRDRVELAATALAGVSNGDGTLATITFEVMAVKPSTLTLSEPLFADDQGNTFLPRVEGGEITEPPELKGDVNADGVVNIQDLVLVASSFGETGENSADINADGVVNIADLVLVAGALGATAAAPSIHAESLELLTAADVRQWLSQAHRLNSSHVDYQRGLLVLEQLLTALAPKETLLLPNYPNPFNPETWIPYQLATSGDVKITIYDARGVVVRRLELGYRQAGYYTNRSRAAYWDGCNGLGEHVASGLYFYHLEAEGVSLLRKMVTLK